jgi:RNA polymerase-binding transcription factor DksA
MFRPGDEVPETAPYMVQHDQHREHHEVQVIEGRRFPFCRQCGEAVRFVRLDASVFKAHTCIESDPDFTSAASASML